jgi:hypothetical protein
MRLTSLRPQKRRATARQASCANSDICGGPAKAAAPKPKGRRRASDPCAIPPGTIFSEVLMTYVYILRTTASPIHHYVGVTDDLRSRVHNHNAMCSPWRLIAEREACLSTRTLPVFQCSALLNTCEWPPVLGARLLKRGSWIPLVPTRTLHHCGVILHDTPTERGQVDASHRHYRPRRTSWH